MLNFDLVNWTMREARQLSPGHHMHSDIEGSSSLNNILLGVPEGERGEPSSQGTRPINVGSVQLTVGNPTARPPSDLTEEPKPETASDLLAYTQAPSAPADGQAAPMCALLKAVVEPDIYTASADRERAIVLRWVLRDIKADRLKLSPAPDARRRRGPGRGLRGLLGNQQQLVKIRRRKLTASRVSDVNFPTHLF
jgi:hypothetical protein